MDQKFILIPYTVAEFRTVMREEFVEALRQQTAPAPRSPKYLTVVETAAYLRIAKQTVYGEHSKGNLPGIKANGRLIFLQDDLDSYLLAGRKRKESVPVADVYKDSGRRGRTK